MPGHPAFVGRMPECPAATAFLSSGDGSSGSIFPMDQGNIVNQNNSATQHQQYGPHYISLAAVSALSSSMNIMRSRDQTVGSTNTAVLGKRQLLPSGSPVTGDHGLLEDVVRITSKIRKSNEGFSDGGSNGSSLINRWNGRAYSARYYEILEKRKSLPVWQQKEEFLQVLKGNQTVILVGETGSGKTTQIPQFVLEAVDIEAPQEMDVTVVEEVGYSIRFEDCSSAKTVLKYLTDGMLLRESVTD
ncbi:hypothetical protein SAY87_003598 [Trapa incisa]|uniref:RNA helicase n=1 Tax=Trapa incisa TaxID=236973 RepID=A0AAN7KST8_9MYRT|nr:hypothetical protein SAY87_003598 [Trapa incisa]